MSNRLKIAIVNDKRIDKTDKCDGSINFMRKRKRKIFLSSSLLDVQN